MSGNQYPSVTDAPVETSAACPSGQAPVFEPVKGERSLLLHICCGPCSIMPVKRLQDEGFTVTAWYMNPNIQPLMEYLRRPSGHRAHLSGRYLGSGGLAALRGRT